MAPGIRLSILIATMPSRVEQLNALLDNLIAHKHSEAIEIIFDNSMEYNIGTKRNKLLELANGEYIVFIDDDDHISKSYVKLILKALEPNPDCVAIQGVISFNGANFKQWYISKKYKTWHEKDNIYYRTPNHISPVRRELALQAGFPEIANGEDYAYSMALLPLLKKETIVKQNLYHYDYVSK